jgi:hypothetical protein
MPDQIIKVPGEGKFRFPADMSDEDIKKAFKNNFPQWYPEAPEVPPPPSTKPERMDLRLAGRPLVPPPPEPWRTVKSSDWDALSGEKQDRKSVV